MTKVADVAVVIAARDATAWLAETLAAVHAQSLAPAEVVVVDDGSRDATAAVAEAAGARVLRQANRGPGAARNAGIAVTRAPWLAFCDADDVWLPGKLQAQLEALARVPAPACACDAFVYDGAPAARRKNAARRVPARIGWRDLLRDNPLIASSVVARRDAVAAAGGFDEDPALIATEDYDLWLRLARAAPLLYLDQPLLRYRVHPGSLTSNQRFRVGVDRILAKVLAAVPGDAEVAALVAARRAGVRLDLAYDAAGRGDLAETAAWTREARNCGPVPGIRVLRLVARALWHKFRPGPDS
ncbi:MAG: glycosyltransferase family 2 protein [Planctomycetes bacterium]|nr:glycosyltransferase family 2 protein [Planctomycetota bacterium]